LEIAHGKPVQLVGEKVDFGELGREKVGNGRPKGGCVGSTLFLAWGFEVGGPSVFGE